jgi:hypothetical protein
VVGRELVTLRGLMVRQASYEKKLKILFLRIGPPSVAPPDVLAGEVALAVDAVGEGVEDGVPSEIVGGAVELVGSGFHLEAEHAACAVAEFGVHGVLREVDLLDGVHGGRVAGLLGGHRGGAVQNDVVLGAGAAADIELRGGPVVEGVLFGGGADDYGGIERGEEERVAVDQREVVGHLRVERERHGRSVELDGHGGVLDRDCVADGTDFELGVDSNVAAGLHEDVFLDVGPESGKVDLDPVGTGNDEVEQVLAAVAGELGLADPGFGVDQSGGRPDDYGTGRIGDCALNFTAGVLRTQRTCETGDHDGCDREHSAEADHISLVASRLEGRPDFMREILSEFWLGWI